MIDDITLGDGLTIKNQSFGVALLSQGFDDVDGIIGYACRIPGRS